MNDEISQGAGPDNAASPAPQEPSGAVSALPKEAKELALHTMAKEDDATDYVAERKDAAAEAKGEPETPPKKISRHQRYKRAIERLRNENASLKSGGGEPETTQSDEAAAVYTGQPEQSPDYEHRIRMEAEFSLRSKDFLQKNPQAREDLETTLQIFPPAEHVAEILMRSEIGPQLTHELTKYPEAIEELNNLPPGEVARVLGIVEGRLRTEAVYADQQQFTPKERLVTRAPRPLSVPSGGASPSSNLKALASKDDATDYWKARKAGAR